MWAGEPELHSVGGTILMKMVIVIFSSIITLKSFDGFCKMGFDKGGKGEKGIIDLRFVGERKCPQKICVIIKE